MTEKPIRKCAAQVAEQREAQFVLADHDRGNKEAEVPRQDPRVTSVLERLSQLETRVGTQLDHLVELQQQQVVFLSVCPSVHPLVSLASFCLCIFYIHAFPLACMFLLLPIVNSNLLAVTVTRRSTVRVC